MRDGFDRQVLPYLLAPYARAYNFCTITGAST